MIEGLNVLFEREDGKTFTIDGNSFFIDGDEAIEGVDFAEWSLYSEQLAFKDGAVVTGASYAGRPMKITFYAKSVEDYIREGVRSFFNPKDTFICYLTYKGVKRWIKGFIESLELPTQSPYPITKCAVGLFCEDPFFKDVKNETKDLNPTTPRWGFPFIAHANYKPVFSCFGASKYTWFDNDGDVDVPFKAYVNFAVSTTGLKIVQGYNEKVFQFNKTFSEGDALEIDFDKATVLLNGSNAWSYVTSNSELLSIPRGGTYLSSDATTGKDLLHVNIQHNISYGGL